MDPTPDPTWFAAARLDELAPGTGLEVVLGGKLIALFRLGERVVALAGLCPHQKAHLAAGVLDPGRSTLTCPRLGCLRWRFDLTTGRNADGLDVTCAAYVAKVEGGTVFVALP